LNNFKPGHDQIICMTLFDNPINTAAPTAHGAD
jgi:hypothetical protein